MPGKPREQVNPVTRLRSLVRNTQPRIWFGAVVIFIAAGYMLIEETVGTLVGEEAGVLHIALQVVMVGLLAATVIGFGRQRDTAGRLLADSERNVVRLMAGSRDAIAVVQDRRVVFGNAALARLTGAPGPETLIGAGALALLEPSDRTAQALNLARILELGQADATETRIVRPDGSVIEAEIVAAPMRYSGRPAVQLVIRDVSARRAEERVLEASERQLRDLLDSMDLIAVSVTEDGTVRFANRATEKLLQCAPGSLTGRSMLDFLPFPDPEKVRADLRAAVSSGTLELVADRDVHLPDGGHRSIRWHLALAGSGEDLGVIAIGEDITDAVETSDRLRALLATAPVGICAVDADGTVQIAEGGPFAQHAADDASGALPVDPAKLDNLAASLAGPLREAIGGHSSEALVKLEGRTYEATFSTAIGQGGRRGAIGVLLEVTQRANLEREGNRLATAIDQAMDAVVITDIEGLITYVNPAFERVSGYSSAEALGQRPSLLRSGEQTDAFYSSLWRTITAGQPWRGELVNRCKDGALFREVASITPVRDREGVIVSFVAVKRDVTRQRALEVSLNREIRQRAAIVAALERIGSSGDPAAIGAAVCEEITRLPGIELASVCVFDGDQAVTLAYAGPSDVPISAGRPLPPSRAEYLQSRAGLGPWAEPWSVRETDGPYGERIAQAGVRTVAYIPLHDGTGVFGVLALGTLLASESNTLVDRLPALGALGAVASSRLAAAVRRTMAEDGAHRDFKALIADRAFRPVFQPIVDLHTGEPLGYEALTRFDDGTPPDVQFQRAAKMGLGVELEIVTLQDAVTAGRRLPAGAYLTLNVSPDAALRPDVLARVLAHVDRPVVLEITEHAVIDDYAALRAVARSLPVPARLAVDDAGAGFASLRHVLELAPDIVKIDRTIVVGIDRDPARQALVAGLRYFAAKRGIQLIAEGIETKGELDALTALAIPLGQGFLLGRPVPVSEIDGATVNLPELLASRSNGRDAIANVRTAGLGAAIRPSVLAPAVSTPSPRMIRRRQAQPPVNPPPLA